MGSDSTEKLIRDSEQLREDLLKLAGRVGAWRDALVRQSATLRAEPTVEGTQDDGPGSGEAGSAPDSGSAPD